MLIQYYSVFIKSEVNHKDFSSHHRPTTVDITVRFDKIVYESWPIAEHSTICDPITILNFVILFYASYHKAELTGDCTSHSKLLYHNWIHNKASETVNMWRIINMQKRRSTLEGVDHNLSRWALVWSRCSYLWLIKPTILTTFISLSLSLLTFSISENSLRNGVGESVAVNSVAWNTYGLAWGEYLVPRRPYIPNHLRLCCN